MTAIMKPMTVALLLVVLAGMSTAAQDTGEEAGEDVVLLTNGASIRGKIIKNEPGQELQIERADGEVFTVPYDRVAAVTDEDKLDEHRQALAEIRPPKKPLKWVNITQLGFLVGDEEVFAVFTYNGVMLNPNTFIGMGLGWLNFDDTDPSGDRLPISGDVRFFTRLGRFQPYLDINGGYAIGLGTSGGLSLGFGAGAKLMVEGAAPIAQIGYRMQSFGEGDYSDTYNFFSAMIGVVF